MFKRRNCPEHSAWLRYLSAFCPTKAYSALRAPSAKTTRSEVSA
jgi:hypothetical protein